jgi:hypothetical protein
MQTVPTSQKVGPIHSVHLSMELLSKTMELLSHVTPAVSFQWSSLKIEIRVAANRKIKQSNRYQLAIQRDQFPNSIHKSLL